MNAVLNIVKNDNGTTPPNPHYAAPNTCTVEVVTPMFLAGAEQCNIGAEGLRGASVKAALRWWWRATVDVTDVHTLAAQEATLFGSTSVGQGLHVRTKLTTWSIIEKPPTSGSMSYLLGQGLYNYREGVVRPAVTPGSKAHIDVLARAASAALNTTLDAFYLFGGLGARSRRGFGSISPCTGPRTIKDLADYRSKIALLISHMPSRKVALEWSHLSSSSRYVVLSREFSTWQDAIEGLGKPFLEFRQSLGGMKAPYGPDHDLVSDHMHNKKPLIRAPERAAFGIPHNYFFKSSKQKLDFHWEDNDRRASPLLFHICKLDNGRFASVALLMDGKFLPSGKRLKTKQTGAVVPAPSYDAIHRFLDQLAKA